MCLALLDHFPLPFFLPIHFITALQEADWPRNSIFSVSGYLMNREYAASYIVAQMVSRRHKSYFYPELCRETSIQAELTAEEECR